jgi:hypothetical protein
VTTNNASAAPDQGAAAQDTGTRSNGSALSPTTPEPGGVLPRCGRLLHGVACQCVDELRLRRLAWLGRPWRSTRKGNRVLEAEGARITVFVHKGDYRWLVRTARVNAFSIESYATTDQAKLAAWDWLHGGGR